MADYVLERVVTTERMPDPSYFIETVTIGMTVTCCVREDRGSFTILREVYEVNKGKHKWWLAVALFRKMAIEKYMVPEKSQINMYKSGL